MEPAHPHSLPGIDVNDALKRLNLDWKQYLGLLHRFVDEVKAPLLSLHDCTERKEWETARRHVLTISVSCMRLCADDLRTKAHELDQAIRNQESNVATLATELADQIGSLSDEITGKANPFDDADVQDLLGSLYDYDSIGVTLRQLESALLTKDNRAISARLEEWEHLGIPPDLLEGFAQIKSLSGSAAFEDAAAITNILYSGLPGSDQ